MKNLLRDNDKPWWKSKTILLLLGQLLMIWSLYFTNEVPLPGTLAVSMTTIAGVIFRSIGYQGITLRNKK